MPLDSAESRRLERATLEQAKAALLAHDDALFFEARELRRDDGRFRVSLVGAFDEELTPSNPPKVVVVVVVGGGWWVVGGGRRRMPSSRRV